MPSYLYNTVYHIFKHMASLVLAAILIELLCNPGQLEAAPSFGTIMPEAGQWDAGGEVNLTFKQEARDYQSLRSRQYFYTASFGFADWFSFDGKLGVGDVTEKTYSTDRVGHKAGFAGGYGCRAKLFEYKALDITGVCGFQHISVHPRRRKPHGSKQDIIWDDWQIQFLTSKALGKLNPYCGLKWSLLYLIRNIDGNRTRRRSRDHIGLIIGADLRMNDYIYVNAEARFFDETALSTGFTVRY